MEVRSEGSLQVRCDKLPAPVIPRTRLQVWFIRVCSSILLWTCLVQLVAVGELWHPRLLTGISSHLSRITPYAYPWWREKEIVSEERRLQGLCPLTPEEVALVMQAMGFDKGIQIYIASGEIYGSEQRLAALRAAFPKIVKKEMLLGPEELQQFQNHSSQMAALDFMVSISSNIFIPTYDGNMAKLVEGHRRYLGFRKSILLHRKALVELLDLHQNGTLSWSEFEVSVRRAHDQRMGQPTRRRVIPDKRKEEDYFYANPQECLCERANCDDLLGPSNLSTVR